jgi:dihydrofolate reductase
VNVSGDPGPKLVLVAAVARNGAIGLGNQLLWREQQDLQHFRALTLGHPVIMGRKTWDSLPPRFQPLPGRRNVVLTRNATLQVQGAETAASLDDALARLAGTEQVFIVGGAQLYALALPRADALVLTEIDVALEGDTHFPSWDRARFSEVSRRPGVGADGVPFAFVRYERL